MKRKLFISLFVLLTVLFITGCNKVSDVIKELNPTGENGVGGWSLKTDVENTIPDQQGIIFERGMSTYSDHSLKPIAFLGSQIVSGTNYMYLCTSDEGFKVVVIYNDLKDNARVRFVNKFDIEKYVNVDIENDNTELSGGWIASSEGGESTLTTEELAMFNTATQKLLGVNYKPITVLATQVVAGTNYAVLAVSETVTEQPVYNMSVLTIYKDLDGKEEVTSVANIDLSEFNK